NIFFGSISVTITGIIGILLIGQYFVEFSGTAPFGDYSSEFGWVFSFIQIIIFIITIIISSKYTK
ncbi:MAG: hypothetical protein AABY22_14435, partial [Nanoarchaeota archaeon]